MRLIARFFRLWFTFEDRVGRLEFALSGLFLASVKYLIDRAIFKSTTGRPWPLTSYLHPSFNVRFDDLVHHYNWAVWALALVSLPFLWVGISMTVRRCLDAGLRPGWSLLFFVPGVNYLMFVLLCFVTSRDSTRPLDPWPGRLKKDGRQFTAWLSGVTMGVVLGLAMIVVSVVLLHRYGMALFLGAPFVMGGVSAFVLNRHAPSSLRAAFGIGQFTLFASALAFLMFALEGAVCLAMFYPMAAPLALVGSWLGRSVALRCVPATAPGTAMALALPLLLALDASSAPPPVREILTAIEIDAAPETVWSNVVTFPDLPAPRELLFRSGIAYPIGARIEHDAASGSKVR